MTDRLEVLRDARRLAGELGAVRDGSHWFEDAEGREIPPGWVTRGHVKPDEVCRVCILGATLLAEVVRGEQRIASWLDPALTAAHGVLGAYDQPLMVDAITERGTPYVLAVLGEMIRREEER